MNCSNRIKNISMSFDGIKSEETTKNAGSAVRFFRKLLVH
ncbi:hypothetical protein HMPREF0663_10140 [Hoylesella oralis ATCC 33269]|uniref:Uncharacterized protein n=1 Tax=Hoylesella oralis ATCC 33269 TaxID=873533 RepID=E7RLZ0_9BACT|nr:hypothetical protein HMPREF0663_10140 [Hoylesella oralis ATCC 33269]